ncbi:MAG TPA: rhodanese-like domain-containing protein [Gemmatimonadaceae bacterium]|jgi:rhodanese-related sulfurtransferase
MPHKSATDLINEAKQRIREVSPREAAEMRRQPDVIFLDVREPYEWNLGHVPGAIHIPRGTLESNVEPRVPREATVVVYCAAGNRSALAADTMQQMGYSNVVSMSDGWRGWVHFGGEVEG